MKPGDILVDTKGNRLILYDIMGSFLCVTDVETQKSNDVRIAEEIVSVEPKPDNVVYLFIVKRTKELQESGLGDLLCQ